MSILLTFVVQHVNEQQDAITKIENLGGFAYSDTLKLNDSFAENLVYTVTAIEIPRVAMIANIAASIEKMPNLMRIEITEDYDPEEIAKMKTRHPQLEIVHRWDPLIELIQ